MVVDLRIPGLGGMVNSRMSVKIIALVGGNPRASSPRGARTGPRVWEGHLPLKLVHLWPWLTLFPLPAHHLPVSLLDLSGAVRCPPRCLPPTPQPLPCRPCPFGCHFSCPGSHPGLTESVLEESKEAATRPVGSGAFLAHQPSGSP